MLRLILMCCAGCAYISDDNKDLRLNPDGDEVDWPHDCNDEDETIGRPTWFIDDDGDGYGDDAQEGAQACESPGDNYVSRAGDCDDANADVNPAAIERCDEIDNNCNESIDDDEEGNVADQLEFYLDADGDGHGDPAHITYGCLAPEGYSSESDDCRDDDPEVYGGAQELCDGKDNDCDGLVDDEVIGSFFEDMDGDGFGDPLKPVEGCSLGPNQSNSSDDCDDSNADINPNVQEICDTIDNNCDGEIDEGLLQTYYQDSDGDGHGKSNETAEACQRPSGYAVLDGDCDDTEFFVGPHADEMCDFIDNNCDGNVDENTAADAQIWYEDNDLDGFGNPLNSTVACSPPGPNHSLQNTDCDDSDPMAFPSAALFEPNNSACMRDADNDNWGDATPTSPNVTPGSDCEDNDASINPNQPEICDGVDTDCDGFLADSELDRNFDNIIDCDESCTGQGMTWALTDHDSITGTDRVSCHAPNGISCDAGNGDTTCNASRPLLCFDDLNASNPGVNATSSSGWSGGEIQITPPIQGCIFDTLSEADSTCEYYFGTGWRTAEFHEGAFEAGNGWGFWAFGNTGATGRFWVDINDQQATCWPCDGCNSNNPNNQGR